ncbi:hypothetical protein AK812_SmicGene4147 [Symbiodinium microadriaticum]|uniref:Uncharacterized protein n=1 Tax=Symbiodinium microadriaticum TaxID=2951 RepID=A0A1Q9EWV9_SYMMI|nr:hypothetical protein AK812_SmicGene4147 [Symbiodinium microadriaticum]
MVVTRDSQSKALDLFYAPARLESNQSTVLLLSFLLKNIKQVILEMSVVKRTGYVASRGRQRLYMRLETSEDGPSRSMLPGAVAGGCEQQMQCHKAAHSGSGAKADALAR